MIMKSVYFLMLVVTVLSDELYSDEEDVDAIINYLLNGGSIEMDNSSETEDESEPVLNGGIWKCGNCEDIDERKLMYSEVNDVDADMMDDQSVDIQVSVAMARMRCVTVHASTAGVVKRMAGACSGPSVTLTVLPAQHFTLQVYGN